MHLTIVLFLMRIYHTLYSFEFHFSIPKYIESDILLEKFFNFTQSEMDF